jgi:predicted esterase
MIYFSGFCFQNEQILFENFLLKNDFTVAGFSYGAIRAFEYALKNRHRIDTLQLFSPAFFQDKSESFKKLQLLAFQKNNNKLILR